MFMQAPLCEMVRGWTAYSIHTLCTRCRQVVCFRPQLLYRHGQSHHHSMDKWIDESQTNADAMNERKMPFPQNKSWSTLQSNRHADWAMAAYWRQKRNGGVGGRPGRTHLLGRTMQNDSEEPLSRIIGCIYHTTLNLRCLLIYSAPHLQKWIFRGKKKFANTYISLTVKFTTLLIRPLVLLGKWCFRDSRSEQ